MKQISVVIICKNESNVIEETVKAATALSHNIIVVDTGSTDGTLQILEQLPVQIVSTAWLGFGPTKNIGNAAAANDWILSLDADEKVDEKLIAAIQDCSLEQNTNAYSIAFLNYLGETPLHYGEWSGDYHIRLFNRQNVHWNDAKVHEELVFVKQPTIKKLKGNIHHRTAKNQEELHSKMDQYATLNAAYYFSKNKKANIFKKYLSTAFNFLKNYILKLGFLDGKAGYIVAIENAKYTYKKYLYLQSLKEKEK